MDLGEVVEASDELLAFVLVESDIEDLRVHVVLPQKGRHTEVFEVL